MNQNTLSLLGCSGSFALVLLVGNAANADTLSPQVGLVVPTSSVTQRAGSMVFQETSAADAQVNPAYATIDPNSDTVGDLAIAKFKCDCPACRVAVVQMLQTGQVSL